MSKNQSPTDFATDESFCIHSGFSAVARLPFSLPLSSISLVPFQKVSPSLSLCKLSHGLGFPSATTVQPDIHTGAFDSLVRGD